VISALIPALPFKLLPSRVPLAIISEMHHAMTPRAVDIEISPAPARSAVIFNIAAKDDVGDMVPEPRRVAAAWTTKLSDDDMETSPLPVI
jgi:hypothetical protein